MNTIPPYRVYHGALTAVNGGPEGDCASATFSAEACASWNPADRITVTNVQAANLLSCDVKNKLPVVGDACDVRVMPNGAAKLFLLTHQIPFRDCP